VGAVWHPYVLEGLPSESASAWPRVIESSTVNSLLETPLIARHLSRRASTPDKGRRISRTISLRCSAETTMTVWWL